ncbi:MAG: amino acid ABC transporter permease [Puniceicoccales bacterium]|nr:amino acid ABC transporter permease [Puniceicoccales bacterium]
MFRFIGCGVVTTLQLLAGGLFGGLALGVLLAILRRNSFGKLFVVPYASVIRGTPLLLQVSIIYFTLPSVLKIRLGVITAGIIALGLNSAAYVAEILRSGIENLSRGQFEAAKTLGISPFYTWKDIILPQVLKNIFPAITGEVIALLKETALISVIGGVDIMRRAQMVAAESFIYFTPLCMAGACYYLLVLSIEVLARKLEKKMRYDYY